MQTKLYTIHSPPKKFELPYKRGFKLPGNRKADSLPALWPSPFINWAWHLRYGILPWASLVVCVAMVPPSSCTPAEPCSPP